MAKHVLVLGATGPSGIIFCEAALAKGLRLTILARNPSKLPVSVSQNANVEVLKGTIDDIDYLKRASKCGAEAFVSFAGPVSGPKVTGTPIADCYRILLPFLAENGIRRLLILSTPSFGDPEGNDRWSIKWSLSVLLIKLIAYQAFQEVTSIGAVVTSQPLDQPQWTLFRVGWLTEKPTTQVHATYLGSGKDSISISRHNIAQWLMQELEDGKWIGKTPVLCDG